MPIPTDDFVDCNSRCDYIYMYPPHYAYRLLVDEPIEAAIADSLAAEVPLNIYVHVPFCRQICSFCNLFTSLQRDELLDAYVAAIVDEIALHASLLSQNTVGTLYFGGGTPSLLAPRHVELIVNKLSQIADLNLVEFCIEASPDTIDKNKFDAYRSLGVDRVSVGVQSFVNSDLESIGRRYDSGSMERKLDLLQAIGFNNICVDLIYGLPGQTLEQWTSNVRAALAIAPETLCMYPLAIRKHTTYGVKQVQAIEPSEIYRRYDIALSLITEAGYQAESHVRFVANSRGGYRQKANHWAGQNVLGFGAGARSYLRYCDVRNGYDLTRRQAVISNYIERVSNGRFARTEGLLLSESESQRRQVILGLVNLDKHTFHTRFGCSVDDVFRDELGYLQMKGLITADANTLKLTRKGMKFRDMSARLFVSDQYASYFSVCSGTRHCDVLHAV